MWWGWNATDQTKNHWRVQKEISINFLILLLLIQSHCHVTGERMEVVCRFLVRASSRRWSEGEKRQGAQCGASSTKLGEVWKKVRTRATWHSPIILKYRNTRWTCLCYKCIGYYHPGILSRPQTPNSCQRKGHFFLSFWIYSDMLKEEYFLRNSLFCCESAESLFETEGRMLLVCVCDDSDTNFFLPLL